MNHLDYKVGDMVINPMAEICGVVLAIEKNNLFDRLQCVKIMYVGYSKPMHVLSDRIRKL
tara:strand:+ start:424 stop:603 length:180 start_codon:yes stop_codon:yes gene_type:complete